jgi:hypothetical protein
MPSLASDPIGHCTLALFCFLTVSAPAVARELEGSITVAGNVVKVQARYDDRTPATGAKICVVDARQQVVATGHINAEGHWAHDLAQAGSYEVRIDAGSGDGDRIEMPFSISPNSIPAPTTDLPPCCQVIGRGPARPVESSSFPWLSAMMGFGFIGGAGVVFWMSRTRNRNALQFPNSSDRPDQPSDSSTEHDP